MQESKRKWVKMFSERFLSEPCCQMANGDLVQSVVK